MQHLFRCGAALLALSATLLTPSLGLAKSIKIYQSPQANSKVVGSIDLAKGIIPIYTPKNSDWIKVANPNNGDTGWVKQSELIDHKGNNVSFSQRYYQSDEGNGHSYQVVEFGNTPLAPMHQSNVLRNLEAQQHIEEKSMRRMQYQVHQLMRELEGNYQQQFELMQSMGMPVIMPIVIMPSAHQPAGNKAVSSSKTEKANKAATPQKKP